MITDEQVRLVANILLNAPFGHNPPDDWMTDTRKALEAYEASKWFDIADEQPAPREIVMNSNNVMAYWEDGKWKGVDGFVISPNAQFWQPLPEFTE